MTEAGRPGPRQVRPTSSFFRCLHAQLGDERGDDGRPSRSDFITHELPRILDVFSAEWDELPELIRGRMDYRVLVRRGALVRGYSVEAQLSPRGVIELIHLTVDTSWPADLEES